MMSNKKSYLCLYDLHICIIEGNIFAITIITTSKGDKG